MRALSPTPSVAPLSTCKGQLQLAGPRGGEDSQEGPGPTDSSTRPPGPLRFWCAVATTGRWTGGAWGP